MKKVKLCDLGKIITGNTPSKKILEFYDSNDIPFIKPDDFKTIDEISSSKGNKNYISENARNNARIAPKNSVLVTCIGIIGKVMISESELSFNQQINAIVPNKLILSKYLAYLLLYNKSKLDFISNAPVVPIINKTQFSEFEVTFHEDIDVQEKIIQNLENLDNQILKRRHQSKLLSNLVKSRFNEMFESKKFDKVSISELVDDRIETAKKKFDQHDTIKYIDISSIDNKNYKMTGFQEYMLNQAPSRAQQHIRKGDIVVSTVRPNLKNIAVTELDDDNLVASSGFCVLRALKCLPEYLFAIICSDRFTNKMTNIVTGANYPAIKSSDIMNYLVPLPPIQLQNEFADFVAQVDKSQFACEIVIKLWRNSLNSSII